jgi:hypothetical protein
MVIGRLENLLKPSSLCVIRVLKTSLRSEQKPTAALSSAALDRTCPVSTWHWRSDHLNGHWQVGKFAKTFVIRNIRVLKTSLRSKQKQIAAFS